MLLGIIIIFIFASVILISYVLLPHASERYSQAQEKKAQKASYKLDNLFVEIEKRKLFLVFILTPLILAGAGFFFSHHIIGGLVGGLIGLAIPNIFIKIWETRRKEKFRFQLLDGILILSSCLKAGLSLLQSIEVLVEDAHPPLSQEFGWVLKEIKMGITLDESLSRVNKRMACEELNLLINSILVSQETGGDLIKVFSRLTITIRDSRKLKDNIRTLTLQGRMQAVIMSLLPLLFIWWVVTFNRSHFDVMLENEIGRMLLFAVAFLQILGMFLIYRFSRIKI